MPSRKSRRIKILVLLLSLISLSAISLASLELTEYTGIGCSHCARVDSTLEELRPEYNLTIQKKEIYYDAENRQEMFELYARFGLDPGKSGVPTVLLDNRSLLVGEIRKERFREIFDEHLADPSVTGIYTEGSFSQIEELDPTATLTLWVLVGAAIADSINPCTIAVMTMLLGVILTTQGKKRMLLASLTFVSVIFISYYLMGLGLLHTITNTQLTNIFFVFVTVAALVLAILEIKAYFRYRPGFFSVEIPVFLRPYMKNVIANATSIPGVAFAALICSLFLLPCSSGPYLVVLGMLAKSVTLQGLLYLFVYNLIFVLPMAFIALVIYLGKATVDEIGRFRETHIRNLHLFAGLLFLLLFLLLLNQMLDIVQM